MLDTTRMPPAAAVATEPHRIPKQDFAQAEHRDAFDAFAAMDGVETTAAVTSDKASAVEARPQPLAPRFTSAAKAN